MREMTFETQQQFDDFIGALDGKSANDVYITIVGSTLELSGGSALRLDGRSQLWLECRSELWIGDNSALQIDGNSMLWIDGRSELWIGDKSALQIDGNSTLWIGKNSSIHIDADSTLRIGENVELFVDGQIVPDFNRENLRKIAPLVLAAGALDMTTIHACETTHCLAGWACHSLPGGRDIERRHGWYTAGMALLGWKAALKFYDSNDDVSKWLSAM